MLGVRRTTTRCLAARSVTSDATSEFYARNLSQLGSINAFGRRRAHIILACGDILAHNRSTTCRCLSILRFATGPKRSMGHVLGAKKGIFLIRGDDATRGHGCRASGIQSIPAQEVSLGSPRAGTIHVHAPTPHTPPLQAFLADFSQQTTRFSHLLAMVCFQGSPRALGCRIDGVCGTGAYPLPDLPRETSRSRSAPEKSV